MAHERPEPASSTATRTGVPVGDASWRPLDATYAESTVTRRFEERVQLAPDALAVVGPTESLSAQELDRRANQLANGLRGAVAPLGRPVAVLHGHDVDLVAAILGVWKAGGILLVLDPQAPPEVLAAIVADADPVAVLAEASLVELAAGLGSESPVLAVDRLVAEGGPERPPLGTGPASPAMLAYSSGTTGDAKAAVLPHRALLHLVRGASDALRLTTADRLPMLFPVSLAVAAYPMLLPLLVGGSLHVRDVRSVGLAGFHEWLADEAITVLYLSPTVARFLGDRPAGTPDGALRVVVLGGERVDGEAVAVVRRAFGPEPVIANGYGTTETGVLTFYVVEEGTEFGPTGVPVGRPIPETELILVRDDGQAAAIGEVGELVVRSRYLCSGYWNRPDLDARVLEHEPETECARYRTGDLAFLDEQGDLVLVGRSDTEVKVQGHRVVPGEVEQAMLALSEVGDAVVEARPDAMGTNELVAWVVPAPGADLAAIRAAASRVLRGPMVPARMVEVAALPQLPNGKLDRQALPAPPTVDPGATGAGAPRSETEAAIAHLWHRILGIEEVGIHTDLADLGAQSLDIAWALVRVEEDLGVRVPMGRMVDVRTVAQMADVVDAIRRGERAVSGLVEVQAGDPDRPRLYLIHDLHGSAFGLRHLAPALGPDQPVWGFESPYLDGPEVPFRSLEMLALRYVTQLRQEQPHGPYHLGGYSFGGVLAFEVARQLVEAGEQVDLLAVVDVGPGYRGRHYDPRKVLDKPWLRLPMPPEDITLVNEAKWFVKMGLRDPVTIAQSLAIRTGLDRWTDPVLFRADIRRNGQIPAGHRLWYAWRKHWELARQYQWEGRRYPGPLLLVWANESASTDGTMGWGDVVDGAIDVVHVDVAHERFLQPDGTEVLGPILRQALDQAIAREQDGG